MRHDTPAPVALRNGFRQPVDRYLREVVPERARAREVRCRAGKVDDRFRAIGFEQERHERFEGREFPDEVDVVSVDDLGDVDGGEVALVEGGGVGTHDGGAVDEDV